MKATGSLYFGYRTQGRFWQPRKIKAARLSIAALTIIKDRLSKVITVLLVIVLSATVVRAEDFSVHLDQIAEIDANRPMPEYELKRAPKEFSAIIFDGKQEKTFDVSMRFKEFGDVRLDEVCEVAPAADNSLPNDIMWASGLISFEDVKAGWIADSPGLFIVAWYVEPGRGNRPTFYHSYVILQLKEHRAHVLMRETYAITARTDGGIMRDVLTHSRFSFDSGRGVLVEKATRWYMIVSDSSHALGHYWKDEGGQDVCVADINEEITLTYKVAEGKLTPGQCKFVYKTQDKDILSEVAHFYLGPFAPTRLLLEANPDLADKYKDTESKAWIYLDEGQNLTIPVPDEWVFEVFGHGLKVAK